jgi:hypothetical protein
VAISTTGKGMGEEFTTQRANKVAAGGFSVAVGCHRAIELTSLGGCQPLGGVAKLRFYLL